MWKLKEYKALTQFVIDLLADIASSHQGDFGDASGHKTWHIAYVDAAFGFVASLLASNGGHEPGQGQSLNICIALTS